jgi:NAD(P)-dependent dehydrogenase (short-subunit alcohol dehydrogenase family)
VENQLPTANPEASVLPVARVLLTGASQGIGKAVLLALARERHFVLGVSRTKPGELADPASSLESDYLAWKPLDLSNTADVDQFASSLEPLAIRALILCAVDYGPGGRHPASTASSQEWQQVIATNCIGHCLLVSRLLPKLMANPPGIIINISSDVALLPGPGRAAYAASKAGLHAMLRAVAAEHPVECLRVYQLIPTFQLVTRGMRRRRPVDFDFSSYDDPDVIAQVVNQFLAPSGSSIAPGTYLVRRDGTMNEYSELKQI